jgi:hypothetical protein
MRDGLNLQPARVAARLSQRRVDTTETMKGTARVARNRIDP